MTPPPCDCRRCEVAPCQCEQCRHNRREAERRRQEAGAP